MTALEDFDRERPRVMAEALLQDPVNVDSFVNCITRNFSIQRHLITEELFDEQFGYSAHPDSGFGWEDVEMGYRLHKRGIKIHFAEDAFSVHISHTSTTDDGVKPLKSLKNFRRLIKKHPSIKNEARRWYIDTFQKIEKWSAGNKHPIVADQQEIRESLGQMYPYPFSISKRRKLRVLSYRWHVPHQYELYKLPHDFTLLSDLGTGFTRAWEFEQRPQPYNATFRSVHDLRVSDYDLAIIHFDENVLSHENCNGVIGPDWGANFRFFVEQLQGIPKVAICHGTPQFIGQYRPDYHESDLGTEIESSRRLLVDYLGDIPVVCNSYQAERSWGFRKSRVIWHGFDPSEFRATDYSGGILSLGKSMRERPHYRGYNHFKYVSEQLPEEYRPTFHSVPRPSLFMINQPIYARLKFDVYKESLRRHAVYFNPTLRSPMPRTRGEAMMSGLVTVSAANHDVQLFIKNGWNGFYSNSSEEMADYLLFLMRNKKSCREVGERSRATAVDIFNHDRYLHSWQSLIDEIVRG
jgi:glycosyltransferase involved in cell wall biosynthesis